MSAAHGTHPSERHGEVEFGPLICPCCGKPWLGPQRAAGVAQATPATDPQPQPKGDQDDVA